MLKILGKEIDRKKLILISIIVLIIIIFSIYFKNGNNGFEINTILLFKN